MLRLLQSWLNRVRTVSRALQPFFMRGANLLCDKCQADCETCQILLKKYGRDDLIECHNCGHLFFHKDVFWIPNRENPKGSAGTPYCECCLKIQGWITLRCCSTCQHLGANLVCQEGGYSDIGDPWKELIEEECNAWKSLI